MRYGLIGLGDAIEGQSKQMFQSLSQQEQQRNVGNRQLERAEKAERNSMASTGAGVGLMAGLGSAKMGATFGAFAGPVGMVLGAGIGLLAASLFD